MSIASKCGSLDINPEKMKVRSLYIPWFLLYDSFRDIEIESKGPGLSEKCKIGLSIPYKLNIRKMESN